VNEVYLSKIQQPLAVPTEPIWRLSVQQYHQMIELGILNEDDPIELLEGWLIYKMPKNPRHRAATKLTRTALETIIPQGWYVDTQEPISLANSEPEPDVIVVRGNTRDYLDRHPGAFDLALVVEIADATLQRVGEAHRRYRTLKQRLYARAGIPVYWLINLVEEQLEVYTQPGDQNQNPTYQQRQDYQVGDEVPVTIEGQIFGVIAVRELLP